MGGTLLFLSLERHHQTLLSLLSLLSLLLILHLFFLSHPPPRTQLHSLSTPCDYSLGQWVASSTLSLYNATACSVKPSQNCIANGRPNKRYLHWRWKPNSCTLPPFDAVAFLALLRHRHVAFIGDSIARNQLESLLCLISTVHSPDLVYSSSDGKNRRWRFPRHGVTVSLLWSPFLVAGAEKSAELELNHNELFLDEIDPNWGHELSSFDVIIFSIGHWLLHPAVYYENRNTRKTLGCHYCPGLNLTEVGFFEIYRRSLNRALAETAGRGKRSVVATFSPAHFDGDWDKAGACLKEEPEEERKLEWMDGEMRRIGREEAERGGAEVLDVTELAGKRPDGHPGAYMREVGAAEKAAQSDCVHWCLPGPIDAWNEILFQLLSRKHDSRQIIIGPQR